MVSRVERGEQGVLLVQLTYWRFVGEWCVWIGVESEVSGCCCLLVGVSDCGREARIDRVAYTLVILL